mmetsp:Transcript_146896/g.381744  ORF Transcript_146896/g.381744 Transcript_146896/m.381744 type:complete len:260 (+) Transcript_146896:29-808(+)
MDLSQKEQIKQRLESISNGVDPDNVVAIPDDISPDELSNWMVSEAVRNDRLHESWAKLAAALRKRLDGDRPCAVILVLMTACQSLFENLRDSLEVDDLDEQQALAMKHQLANLMAFIGNLFRHQAIRGNSIIHCSLNSLLGWDQEGSRWRGRPHDFEVNSACALLLTVGRAYVGTTHGSSVYLTRLRNLERAGLSQNTQGELVALIQTWEQEWANSRVVAQLLADLPWSQTFDSDAIPPMETSWEEIFNLDDDPPIENA